MRFAGANPNPVLIGEAALPGKIHYLLGDASDWHTSIDSYASVRYQSLYPGIDLRFHGERQQLEYDFIVAPGAEPAQIRLRFEGADELWLDHDGNLIVETAAGPITQQAPIIYQEKASRRESISGRYVLSGADQVGFQIDDYDASRLLIIDPVVYSTFLGGSDVDFGYGIAIDSSGAYVTGALSNPGDFPSLPGGYQAPNPGGFVTKFTPAGDALVYTAFIHGAGYDIALNGQGNAHVAGYYHPCQFCYGQGFALKLSVDGSSLVYFLTPLGSYAKGIAVDYLGNAHVAGETDGTNFFATSGAFQTQYGGYGDGFITKLDEAGNTLYASFLGGSSGDSGEDVAIDHDGFAYLTGYTGSPTFPVINAFQPQGGGSYDAFLTKVNLDGSALVYSTYFGGSDGDFGYGITVDIRDRPHLTGYTFSWDNFPLKDPYQSNGLMSEAFVSKFDTNGMELVYSTFLGGGDWNSVVDEGRAIAVDPDGNAIITGRSATVNYPVTDNAPQGYYAGDFYDVILSKLSPDGQTLLLSAYLGGLFTDQGWDVAVDSAGAIYVTGNTSSFEFPTVDPFQETIAIPGVNRDDAFVTKIDEAAPPKPLVNLALAVETDPAIVHGGDPIEYTFTIDNAGPDAATGAELIARIDFFSTFVSIRPSQGSCSGVFATYHIECELGVIPGGESATVLLNVLAPDVNGGSTSVDGFTYSNELDTDNRTNNNRSVTLISDEIYQLNVSVGGDGGVRSTNVLGIKCPPDCEELYVGTQGVILRATPAPGAEFFGWGGACSGKNSTCTAYMDGDRSVTAAFSESNANLMHVAGIQPGYRLVGDDTWAGTRILIVAENGAAIPGATVAAELTTPSGDTHPIHLTTNANGIAQGAAPVGERGTYTLCVTNVSKNDWFYWSGANVETCDSIVVP